MHEIWLNCGEVSLYITTSQSGGKWQGNTRTDVKKYRQINLIVHTVRPSGIDITHSIGLVFSPIIIKSYLWVENNLLFLNHFFTSTYDWIASTLAHASISWIVWNTQLDAWEIIAPSNVPKLATLEPGDKLTQIPKKGIQVKLMLSWIKV